MSWWVNDTEDREIVRGGLEECVRALLTDETAAVVAEDEEGPIRTYLVHSPDCWVEVIKSPDNAHFLVNEAEADHHDHGALLAAVRQVSAALEAAGATLLGEPPKQP
jgi:hypothetical protein